MVGDTRAMVFPCCFLNLKLHWRMVGVEAWFVFLLLLYQNWLKAPQGFSVKTNKGGYIQGNSRDSVRDVILSVQ